MTDVINHDAPPALQGAQNPERDVFEVRPSAKGFLGQIIWGIVLLPVVIGVFLLINVWYKTHSVRYRLTTQRFFVTKGLIGKHVEELELFRIKDITLRQGALQRMLGLGTITILSTDDTNPQIEIAGIKTPYEIKDRIRENYRATRKGEGMRSAEFIQS